jgi:hypothetical protein
MALEPTFIIEVVKTHTALPFASKEERKRIRGLTHQLSLFPGFCYLKTLKGAKRLDFLVQTGFSSSILASQLALIPASWRTAHYFHCYRTGINLYHISFARPQVPCTSFKSLLDLPLVIIGSDPLSRVFSLLSGTIHRDSAATSIVNGATVSIANSLQAFPYALSPWGLTYTRTLGIHTNAFGTTPHPHPIHKAMEMHILRHLPNREATTVYFMKDEKFQRIAADNNALTQLNNVAFVPRDINRYRRPAARPEPCLTPRAFWHDSIMFTSGSDVASFFKASPTLQTLTATFVGPHELRFGLSSLIRQLYFTRIHSSSNELEYHLETPEANSGLGYANGAYVQPLDLTLFWLKTGVITTPDFQLQIEFVESFGSNIHQLIITRLELAAPSRRPFAGPDAYLLPNGTDLQASISDRLVPAPVYNELFTYTRAVRTLRVTDPHGFVRTQKRKPEYAWVSSAAWDHLGEFSSQTAGFRPVQRYRIYDTLFSRIRAYISRHRIVLRSFLTLVLAAPPLAVIPFLPPNPKEHYVGPDLNRRFMTPLAKGFSRSFELLRRRLVLMPRRVRFVHRFYWYCLDRWNLTTPRFWMIIGLTTISGLCVLYAFVNWIAYRNAQQAADNYRAMMHPTLFDWSQSTEIFAAGSPSAAWDFDPPPPPSLPPPPEPPIGPIQDSPNHPRVEMNGQLVRTQLGATGYPLLMAPTVAPHLNACDLFPDFDYARERECINDSCTHLAARVARFCPCCWGTSDPYHPLITRRNTVSNGNPYVWPIDDGPLTPVVPVAELASSGLLPSVNAENELTSLEDLRLEIQTQPEYGHIFPVLPAEDGPCIDVIPPTRRPESNVVNYSVDVTLESDVSAQGPALPVREIHQFSWGTDCGLGLSRRRNMNSPRPPYPSNDCLLTSLAPLLNTAPERLWEELCSLPDSQLTDAETRRLGLSSDHLEFLMARFDRTAIVHTPSGIRRFNDGLTSTLNLYWVPHHWSAVPIEAPRDTTRSSSVPVFPQGVFPLMRGEGVARATRLPMSTSHATRVLNPLIMNFRTSTNHVIPTAGFLGYQPEYRRAKNLISNMKNGYDGILHRLLATSSSYQPDHLTRLDALVDALIVSPPNRHVDLLVLEGFAGSGKSDPIKRIIRSITSTHVSFRVSVPSTQLRGEWKDDCRLSERESWRFGTWESSLLKSSNVLIIDELYKLPRGYLDLCIALDPAITTVIVLCDPCQGEYHSTSPHSLNNRLPSESQYLMPFCLFYQFWTYRSFQLLCRLWDVPCFSSVAGTIGFRSLPSSRMPLIVASTGAALAQTEMGYSCVTASASQGLTFRAPAQLMLDRPFLNRISPQVASVALTRSRSGIVFTGDLQQAMTSGSRNQLLSSVIQQTSISYLSVMANELTGRNIVRAPMTLSERDLALSTMNLRGGNVDLIQPTGWLEYPLAPAFRSLRPRVAALLPRNQRRPHPDSRHDLLRSNETVLRTSGSVCDHADQAIDTMFLPETRRPHHSEIPTTRPPEPELVVDEITDPVVEPVYPGIDYQLLFNLEPEPINAIEKEITFQNTLSNQFDDLNEPYEFGTNPCSGIAARHDGSKDPTLLPASIVKRLRFRPSDEPVPLVCQDIIAGDLLFASHCRAYKRDVSTTIDFDPLLFAECISLNEYNSLTSKTKQVIQANAHRSHPDWRHTVVDIFSKTQQKINEGSIFGPWKACQTLALMHDTVLLIFGPVVKYLEAMDKRDAPQNLFKYGGRSPREMSEFSKRFVRPRRKSANDYTGFDTNQGREAQRLEELRMRYFSIPVDMIEWYVHLKTNLSCQFGNLTSMRFTGEPGTYCFNSDFNLAVTYLRHDIPDDVAVFISGDDSLIDCVLPLRSEWALVEKYFHKLQFKLVESDYGSFCGYYVSHVGAVRGPRTLFFKLMLAHADHSIPEKLASYLTEFNVGHSLGDALWDCIDPAEAVYQMGCFDYFCRESPRAMKVALKTGPLSDDDIMRMSAAVPDFHYTLFNQLPHKLRRLYAKLGRKPRISL